MGQSIEQMQAELEQLQQGKGITKTKAKEKDLPPTADWMEFVVWNTWKHGPNKGQGEFDDWAATEGKRLTEIQNQRLQKNIEEHADDHSESAQFLVRWWNGLLSWNYSVPADSSSGLQAAAFKILNEEGKMTGMI